LAPKTVFSTTNRKAGTTIIQKRRKSGTSAAWYAISEGTLLASVAPDSVSRIREALDKVEIPSYELGRFDSAPACSTVCRNGVTAELVEPDTDPFRPLFFAGLRQAE